MRKRCLVVILLPASAALSWAGSFYTSITLTGTRLDAVVSALKSLGLKAIVVAPKGAAAVNVSGMRCRIRAAAGS